MTSIHEIKTCNHACDHNQNYVLDEEPSFCTKDPLASFIIVEALKREGLNPNLDGLKVYLTHIDFLSARHKSWKNIGAYSGDFMEYVFLSLENDEDKAKIFSSVFELGNPSIIDQPNQNKTSIYPAGFHEYLKTEYILGIDSYKLVDSIMRELSQITDTPFECFIEADRSLAFKVVTLFYRICTRKPKLFTFLKGGNPDKANFEFATIPYSSHKNSSNDSVLLSEILTSLMFQMPPEYLAVARKIREELIPGIQTFVKLLMKKVKSQPKLTGEESKRLILNLLNEVMPIGDLAKLERLDFRVFLALIIKDYEVKVRSNSILNKILKENPIQFITHNKAELSKLDEIKIIQNLLGDPNALLPRSLHLEAQLVINILHLYGLDPIVEFTKFQIALIKAVILHDSVLNISIPTVIQGATYTPKLVNSIFRDLTTYYEREKRLPPLEGFNNTLLCFWDLRVKQAFKIINNIGQDKLNLQVELEDIVDQHLLSLFSKIDMQGIKGYLS